MPGSMLDGSGMHERIHEFNEYEYDSLLLLFADVDRKEKKIEE